MKLSNYNIILYDDKYSYWFNSLNFKYFRLSAKVGKFMEGMLCNLDMLEKKHNQFFNKLKESGFIVEDSLDELPIIREKNRKAVFSKEAFLIIIPTLDCNYKCWYCIQNHIPSKMDDETMDKVKKFIHKLIVEESITSLHIDWFGGEPLMYFEDVVKPISIYAKNECEKVGIPFVNGTTTNAFFINEELIREFKELNFKQFQITIDGNQKFHDRVKFMEDLDSAFARSLQAINNIVSEIEGTNTVLRINYTHSNTTEEIIDQINQFIEEDNRPKVQIIARKVWQEKADKAFSIRPILKGFKKYGYIVENWSLPLNFIPCYTCREKYHAISYNGNLIKCTACDDLYSSDKIGFIDSNGEAIYKDGIKESYTEESYENEQCLSCKLLPVCMGLCPRNYKQGNLKCCFEGLDSTPDELIINLINDSYE